jgi:hypothetical protein
MNNGGLMDKYNLGTDDLSEISRWFQSRKAAGIEPQPWELERLITAKYQNLYNQQAQNRALGIAEQRAALGKDELAERIRMQNEMIKQNALNRESMDTAGKWNLGSQLASAALVAPYLQRRVA